MSRQKLQFIQIFSKLLRETRHTPGAEINAPLSRKETMCNLIKSEFKQRAASGRGHPTWSYFQMSDIQLAWVEFVDLFISARISSCEKLVWGG